MSAQRTATTDGHKIHYSQLSPWKHLLLIVLYPNSWNRIENIFAMWVTVTYTMPNEKVKPVIHCTSTMKTVLKTTKVLHPILQKCLFRYPVTQRYSSSKPMPLGEWSKSMAWKFTLMKTLMKIIKHVAVVSEIIHSTLNIRRKNKLAQSICNKGIYTLFYI